MGGGGTTIGWGSGVGFGVRGALGVGVCGIGAGGFGAGFGAVGTTGGGLCWAAAKLTGKTIAALTAEKTQAARRKKADTKEICTTFYTTRRETSPPNPARCARPIGIGKTETVKRKTVQIGGFAVEKRQLLCVTWVKTHVSQLCLSLPLQQNPLFGFQRGQHFLTGAFADVVFNRARQARKRQIVGVSGERLFNQFADMVKG